MTSHAAVRVGWFRWWFPRTAAAITRWRWRFTSWNDARYERREREVWGDDYAIGDYRYVDDCSSDLSRGQRCDADWGSATPSQRCWRIAGHEGQHVDGQGYAFGESAPARAHVMSSSPGRDETLHGGSLHQCDCPELPSIPDDGWRPTSGHALHELSTWQPDSWTQDLPLTEEVMPSAGADSRDDSTAGLRVNLPGPVAHPQAHSPAGTGESSVAVPVSRERVLTATVRATPTLARTRPEAAGAAPPPAPDLPVPGVVMVAHATHNTTSAERDPAPAATRYAPTADEIRATLHARVIKALGGVDANGWDTVVTRIYEDAAAKVYTGERM